MEDNEIYWKLIFSVRVGIVGTYIGIKNKHWRIPTYPAKKPFSTGSGLPVFFPLFTMATAWLLSYEKRQLQC